MSFIGDLAFSDQRSLEYDAEENPASEIMEPGVWHNFGGALADSSELGVISGWNSLASSFTRLAGTEFASTLATGFGAGYTPGFDAERHTENASRGADDLVEEIGQDTASAAKALRPNATTTGMAGQLLSGLAEVVPRYAIASVAGGPVVGAFAAGAPQGYTATQVAKSEGIDESTAIGQGLIEGAVTTIGALIPGARIFKSIPGDLAAITGANVGLGMAGRGATAALLENNGYTAQAAQYRAFDKTAMLADGLLGLVFGGIGRAGDIRSAIGRRPTNDQINAALTERNAQHFDVDTAPGAPINPRSAVAHQDALKAAIDQINRGEPVVLPDSIHSAEFMRAADDASPIAPSRDQALASARQDIEPALRVELEQEAAGILPNVKDVRAELATLSKSIDGLDATFRARAKEFQQQGQSRKQAEAQAREAIASERLELTDRQTALNDSLTGNRTAELARADLVALNRGEVPKRFEGRLSQRADAIVKGFDKSPLAAGVAKGNKVSLAQVAREEISRIMADLDRAEPTLQAKPLDIGQPRVAAESATNAAKPVKDATQPAKTRTSDPKNATSEPKDATQAKGEQGDSDPVVQVADEILARSDDIRIATGAMDEDGNPVTLSARELLAEADADIARAQEESKGFAAAAACFLQRGAA